MNSFDNMIHDTMYCHANIAELIMERSIRSSFGQTLIKNGLISTTEERRLGRWNMIQPDNILTHKNLIFLPFFTLLGKVLKDKFVAVYIYTHTLIDIYTMKHIYTQKHTTCTHTHALIHKCICAEVRRGNQIHSQDLASLVCCTAGSAL